MCVQALEAPGCILIHSAQAGYREGITAGKEGALQEGFDSGFATIGVPLGRQIGLLRGLASALLSYLKTPTSLADTTQRETLLREARVIVNDLSLLRFSDIAPPDLEAEQHAREHLAAASGSRDEDDEIIPNEEIQDKRNMEGLEDLMGRMNASGSHPGRTSTVRPTMEDVRLLEHRLQVLLSTLNMPYPVG